MTAAPPAAVERLVNARALEELAALVRRNRAVTASGLWGSSVALVTAALDRWLGRPILLLCGHLDEVDDLADDMELFHGRRPQVLSALELSASLGRVSEEQAANRLKTVARLAESAGSASTDAGRDARHAGTEARRHEETDGRATQHSESAGSASADAGRTAGDGSRPLKRILPPLLVASVQSLMQSVPSRKQVGSLVRTLRAGDRLEPEKLIVWLSEHGYNRLEQVEVPGDFAVRGGIIDIYIPGDFEESGEQVGLTVRLDFFDDTLESIRMFDLDTLGSGKTIDGMTLMDVRGLLPDAGDSVSLLSYLPEETIVVLWAPLEIAEQARSYFDRLPDVRGLYPLSAVLEQSARFTRVELSQFGQESVVLQSLVRGQETPAVKLPIRSLQKFETDVKKALAEVKELAGTHDVTILCENTGELQRLSELLDVEQPGLRPRIEIKVGYVHRGFVWEEGSGFEVHDAGSASADAGTVSRNASAEAAPTQGYRPLALFGHHELFHRYEMRRRTKRVIASRPIDSFLDLQVGDYVVHVAHGIAKFTGIHTIDKDGKNEEYLTLRFAENASLHVPANRINLIQKYVGGFHGHPKLSRLGSGVWEKEKAKVAEAVMDMAAELLEVQAARAAELGEAFPPDTEWQKEFEAEFPYEPTADQVTGAEEIKQDMEKHRPMDRLLCGDVGYGKTELAMRAAFKCIEYGKQVAVLVPTTVLAEQHHRSFSERMAAYPFAVECISRFRTPKQQKDILKATAAGQIDVLIGTHRLLSQDVKFADLGLVVIDEEQRFGVTHKERLKQMRRTVDVLTMSATPIPRTLHMSMLGLRDISSLTTAPQDRRSIVTEVMPFEKNRVQAAVLRELNREGQIYYVHNRIADLYDIAQMLQGLVPDARIVVGHGQMEHDEMEQAMLAFIRHDADILVSTTIIESGLDIPNANTMFIDEADRYGLSELHQLRGRVGRWKHRAYCYLILPHDRPVTPVAAKRLKAIEEYSHLGAGFKIAMRDLEIRGAGNILGPEQSGHINTVGYEMYCQLLEDATRALKKEPRPIMPEAHVEIGVTASIPRSFITGDRQRLDAYRRMSRCTSLEMLAELMHDLKDAFGEPPKEMLVVEALTELRLLAGHWGVDSIIKQPPDVILKLRDAQRVQKALVGAPGSLRIVDGSTLYFRPPGSYLEGDVLLMVLRNLMRAAYEREQKGESAPAMPALPPLPPVPKQSGPPRSTGGVAAGKPIPDRRKPGEKPAAAKGKAALDLEKLVSLYQAGILTEPEFESAKRRVMEQA
ncbi:MAG: transcription-repair coupling factor [Tepidisphaeraceae bacterium]|jgi:transcription-repair coupling factor (superfamily II helicase)